MHCRLIGACVCVLQGKRHGVGVYAHSSGFKYNGRVLLAISAGADFRTLVAGQWQEGKMHGQGIFEYPSHKETKARYEGDFLNNYRHGHGKR